MPNNYQFLDANSSVQTAASSVVSGAHQPIVQIGSFLSAVPTVPSGNQSVSGTVNISGTPSVSGTVNIGNTPSISGTVNIGTIPGSVVAYQGGSWTPSAISYSYRNDTLASTLGADLTFGPASRDSAGRTLIKPFSAEESRIEGYTSVVSTSVTTLIAAAGTGLRNYITDLWFANTGAANTLITLKDGAGSILGYTIAPTLSGSNLPGLQMPIRTGANASFDFQAGTGTSILYATAKGFKAP